MSMAGNTALAQTDITFGANLSAYMVAPHFDDNGKKQKSPEFALDSSALTAHARSPIAFGVYGLVFSLSPRFNEGDTDSTDTDSTPTDTDPEPVSQTQTPDTTFDESDEIYGYLLTGPLRIQVGNLNGVEHLLAVNGIWRGESEISAENGLGDGTTPYYVSGSGGVSSKLFATVSAPIIAKGDSGDYPKLAVTTNRINGLRAGGHLLAGSPGKGVGGGAGLRIEQGFLSVGANYTSRGTNEEAVHMGGAYSAYPISFGVGWLSRNLDDEYGIWHGGARVDVHSALSVSFSTASYDRYSLGLDYRPAKNLLLYVDSITDKTYAEGVVGVKFDFR